MPLVAAVSPVEAGIRTAAIPGSSSRAVRRPPQDVSVFVRQYEERQRRFLRSLEELANECERRDLPDAAAAVRAIKDPPATVEVRLSKLPRAIQPDLPADMPVDERYWKSQLRHHRQAYARDLYTLSRKALSAGYVSFAYERIREVVQNDSDHAAARRILGYVRLANEWLSPFEAQMAKTRKVFHPRFGWIARENADKYEDGQRPFQGRWISAAKDAEIRRDFRNAWEVRTEHYLIRTNHSLEKGVELAVKLERFHELFFQVLAGFFNSADQAKQLFEGANGRAANQLPHQNEVYFFRTREEYLAELRKKTKQDVEITRGMFFADNGIAYFYDHPDSDDDSTLYHEGTHQLLAASRPQTGPIGVRGNFWLIEGIACYMESFQRQGDRCTIGNPNALRVRRAREHLLKESYYIPLEEFARMGMVEFQTDPNIKKNYSQCAAMTHFFLHARDGKYREALIEHLSQIYSPRKTVRESPESLSELTGVPDTTLDEQYKEYMLNLGKPKPPVPDGDS